MDLQALGNLPVDGAQELQELAAPVAGQARADHRAGEHVKRGKQGGRAVALVVAGHGASPGVSKPSAAFFDAVIAAASLEAGQIAYVGDRLDNDLRPAKAAGMRTVFLRRGPWGYIFAQDPGMAAAADWPITSLADLPAVVAAASRSAR